MALALTLADATVEVVPGRSAGVDVVVRNDGAADESFRLEAAGRAGPWVAVPDAGPWTPVGPGGAETVSLVVTPPPGAARAGQLVPFTVLARTQDGTHVPVRATCLVSVLSAPPVIAALTPTTSRSATASQHAVELTTDDPTGVLVTLSGRSADPRTTVAVEPVAVRVEPSRPAAASVTVRPGRPAVLSTRAHPFEVLWETDGPDGLVRGACAGRLEQTPRLPPVVTALLAAVLVAGLAAAAWAVRPAGDDPPTPAPGSTPTTGGPPTTALVDPVAVVQVQLQDRDPAATRARAQAVADGLRLDGGLRTEVVDSAQGPPGYRPGYWLVVVRGFADAAAVTAFCATPPPGAPACQPPP